MLHQAHQVLVRWAETHTAGLGRSEHRAEARSEEQLRLEASLLVRSQRGSSRSPVRGRLEDLRLAAVIENQRQDRHPSPTPSDEVRQYAQEETHAERQQRARPLTMGHMHWKQRTRRF